ncbi:hypothetical protein V8C42DRAFT_336686 [Trichoderma barbatum]
MSHELAKRYYDEFEKMQSTLNLFAENIPPEERLTTFSTAIDKVLHLWDAPGRSIHISTTKRYNSTKTFLLSLFDIGHDAFFLCALSISVTRIGTLKQKQLFFEAVQMWMKEKADEIPTPFTTYISQLYEKHKTFFEKKLQEQRQQRSSSNPDDISEPELSSHHMLSRYSTLSEDTIPQDNISTSILRQGDLVENISTPRISSEDIRPISSNNQSSEVSSFRTSALHTLEHAEICSVSKQAIYALTGDNISRVIHLALPADSSTHPFLIIPITPETAYHICKLETRGAIP